MAMEANPQTHDQLVAKANQLHHFGDIEAEIKLRLELLRQRPDDHRNELSLALALLLLGRHQQGWPHYEARLKGDVAITVPHGMPRWDGRSQPGELLLVAEQGIGDVVQALRHLPQLAQQIPTLAIVAQPHLHSLLRHCGWFTAVFSFEQTFELGENSAWLPLMSLPLVLQLRAEQLGAAQAYLTPDPGHGHTWRQRLRPATPNQRIVALHWQGNPLTERGGAQGRSLALETFKPMAKLGDLKLVSVQKGAGEEQLAGCSFFDAFVDCQPTINRTWDLTETLAILAACDLVITSDSAIAHLAGALGRPTWVLLKAVPDWRWGLSGEQTPLYPSARLFRQPTPGDWQTVMANVCQALGEGQDRPANPGAEQAKDDCHEDPSVGAPVAAPETMAEDPSESRLSHPLDLYNPLLSYRHAIFEAHCSHILSTYLEPWVSFFRGSPPRDTRLEAVIVETRPSATLRAVILNCLLMLPAGTLVILITSQQSEAAMAALLGDLGADVQIRTLANETPLDIKRYSQLLCEPEFWQSFSAATILIFQNDSLLLEPLPESFLSTPYLGAPWHSDGELNIDFPHQAGEARCEHDQATQMVVRASMVLSPGLIKRVPHGYGNGGLSLRNRALMETITRAEAPEAGEPEDVFFSRHWPRYCDTPPDINLARQFSVETIYADAIGMHASWKYLAADKQALLHEKHIKTLISMSEGLI